MHSVRSTDTHLLDVVGHGVSGDFAEGRGAHPVPAVLVPLQDRVDVSQPVKGRPGLCLSSDLRA